MFETVTLQIPDELANRAKETAARTGRSLESVLVEWLTWSADVSAQSGSPEQASFEIYTPYGNDEAAQILADVLDEFREKRKQGGGTK